MDPPRQRFPSLSSHTPAGIDPAGASSTNRSLLHVQQLHPATRRATRRALPGAPPGPAATPARRGRPPHGPLSALKDRRILVLADVENLSYSAAKHHGLEIVYETLGQRLSEAAAGCALHAFFSADPQRTAGQRAYFEARGWSVHHRPIEVVQTYAGEKRRANIDTLLLFQAGLLCSRGRTDTVVLTSGDGDLVCDLARALAELPTPRQVLTLSLAGSTSWRLNAQHNRGITANLEIGCDCLRPLARS